MEGYVIGTAENGEQLRFEGWVYWNWIHGNLHDPELRALLKRCKSFWRTP